MTCLYFKVSFCSYYLLLWKLDVVGPLLFLLYVNDLNQTSNLLNPMFADDTNLFYSHKDIKLTFNIVKEEVIKLNKWFQANKLSLIVDKTKYNFFHELQILDGI